jgi:hypothetical protein
LGTSLKIIISSEGVILSLDKLLFFLTRVWAGYEPSATTPSPPLDTSLKVTISSEGVILIFTTPSPQLDTTLKVTISSEEEILSFDYFFDQGVGWGANALLQPPPPLLDTSLKVTISSEGVILSLGNLLFILTRAGVGVRTLCYYPLLSVGHQFKGYYFK